MSMGQKRDMSIKWVDETLICMEEYEMSFLEMKYVH